MKKDIYVLALCVFLLLGCQEYKKEPLVVTDEKPQSLGKTEVENLPGGAKVSYTLPDDKNALYVVAEYTTGAGIMRVVKSSIYQNYLLLEGFSSTDERVINLYVVNRSEEKSSPVEVKINPLAPPIKAVYQSLEVTEDFGGVNIKFQNPERNEYVIYMLVKGSTGDWEIYDRNYTSIDIGNYSVHGLESEEKEFAFFVRDKWENYSDTTFATLTPFYEEELDKTLWTEYPLDNDAYKPLYSNRKPDLMWDGSIETSPYATDPVQVNLPQWLTIDLGQYAIFSRARVQGFWRSGNESRVFSNETPRVYEIWGYEGEGAPPQSGEWDNWVLIAENTSIKPSGLPLRDNTPEDIQAAIEGDNFSIPFSGEGYRYIRFKTLETWGHVRSVMLGELTLWGIPE